MKTDLANVTITLEEEVVSWAQLEAARRGTSVPRLLAELLKQHARAGWLRCRHAPRLGP
jgi:hypothetical protein